MGRRLHLTTVTAVLTTLALICPRKLVKLSDHSTAVPPFPCCVADTSIRAPSCITTLSAFLMLLSLPCQPPPIYTSPPPLLPVAVMLLPLSSRMFCPERQPCRPDRTHCLPAGYHSGAPHHCRHRPAQCYRPDGAYRRLPPPRSRSAPCSSAYPPSAVR